MEEVLFKEVFLYDEIVLNFFEDRTITVEERGLNPKAILKLAWAESKSEEVCEQYF